MSFKKTLALGLFVLSMGAHAIPPIPPSAVFNKIKTSAAQNCITDEDIRVSDLKDTANIKFILQLNNDNSAGILTVMVNGAVAENFNVKCK